MLVYYFVPFIVSNRYLLFWVSNGHNSVTVQNRTHVYMNFFDHKDLGNHLLQLCPKVVKHPVYICIYFIPVIYIRKILLCSDRNNIYICTSSFIISTTGCPLSKTKQKLFHITLMAPRIFWWLLDFWKIFVYRPTTHAAHRWSFTMCPAHVLMFSGAGCQVGFRIWPASSFEFGRPAVIYPVLSWIVLHRSRRRCP